MTASDHFDHLTLSAVGTFEFHSVNVECFCWVGSTEGTSLLSINSTCADIDGGTTALAEGKVGRSGDQVGHSDARAVSWLQVAFALSANGSRSKDYKR